MKKIQKNKIFSKIKSEKSPTFIETKHLNKILSLARDFEISLSVRRAEGGYWVWKETDVVKNKLLITLEPYDEYNLAKLVWQGIHPKECASILNSNLTSIRYLIRKLRLTRKEKIRKVKRFKIKKILTKNHEINDITVDESYVYKLTRQDLPNPFKLWEDQPFYFGKGTGGRLNDHRYEAKTLLRKPGKKKTRIKIIHDLWEQGLDFNEEIVFDNLSHKEAFDLEKKLIKKYGRIKNGTGCLANESNGGEGGKWTKTPEEMLEDIKLIYGEGIYNMFVNYQDELLITQIDIAKEMGVSREYVRQVIEKIYEEKNLGMTKRKERANNRIECYSGDIQGVVGERLKEEGINYRRKSGSVWECESGGTFTIHKLSLHKNNGLYSIDFRAKTDYVIAKKDNNTYLIPFPNYDVERVFFHYPQDLKQYNDFTCLKNPDLNKDEKKSNHKEFIIEIPYGYCHCGCGQKTNIVKITNKKSRNIKGEPYKYLGGHSPRKFKIKDIEDMVNMFNQMIPIDEIANSYNVTYPAILYHLRKNNIINPVSSNGYSCQIKKLECSICGEEIIRKRKSKEVVCTTCRKNLKNQ